MIRFTCVRWKNLLGTGNYWIEIPLDKYQTTLLIGQNGAGKSTILDAISFALFNKPFRKVNKGQLINTITNKGLVVKLEFQKGANLWKVCRGSKPTVFEIYKDGELVDQNAEAKDYQAYLETILDMNHKAFTQIVNLGSASFVPFMQLTVPARREVIEDFLDIQIFSEMNERLRKRISTHKTDVAAAESKLNLAKAKLEHAENVNKDWQKDVKQLIADKHNKIDEIAAAAIEVAEKLEAEEKLLATVGDVSSEEDKLNRSRSALEKDISKLEHDIRAKQKEVWFLQQYDDCPTCHQAITEEFKIKRIEEHEKEIESLATVGHEHADKLKQIETRLNEIFEISKKLKKHEAMIGEYQREIGWYKSQAEEVQAEIEKIQNRKPLVDTKTHKQEVQACSENLQALDKKTKVLIAANALLKDDGIKALIIRQYIPIVNDLINKYLMEMDFFVDFHLNEAFEESIRSRHRDEFSYWSFSEGQKLRIDLAVLFAWREVAKKRNSTATNLLILDEILDSSLDNSGVEDLIRIIKSLFTQENIFVISHRGDAVSDKFDMVYKFFMEHGFSQMVEA